MHLVAVVSALWVLPLQAEKVHQEEFGRGHQRTVNVDYNAALASSAAQLLRRASDEDTPTVALHSTVTYQSPTATCSTCPTGCIKEQGCYQPSTNSFCQSEGGEFCGSDESKTNAPSPSGTNAPSPSGDGHSSFFEGSLNQGSDFGGADASCEMCGPGTACIIGSSCHKSSSRSDCAKNGGEWCVVQSSLTKVEGGGLSDASRTADAKERSWDVEPLVGHHSHKKKHKRHLAKKHKRKLKKKAHHHHMNDKQKHHHHHHHHHGHHHSGGAHSYSNLAHSGAAGAELKFAFDKDVLSNATTHEELSKAPTQVSDSSKDDACKECEGGCVVGDDCHVEFPAECVKEAGKWCPGNACGDCWGGCLINGTCHQATLDNEWGSPPECKKGGGMWCPETNGLTCTTCEGGCLIQDRCYMLAPKTNTPASNTSCKVDGGQFCALTKAQDCKDCYKGCIVEGVCHMSDPVDNRAFDKSTCDKYKGEFCAEWSGGKMNISVSDGKQTEPAKATAVHKGPAYAFILGLMLLSQRSSC